MTHPYKQSGDTIIEVMIALVVLLAALAGAFAVGNRSTKTTQDNHERYQAQLIANEQAELIRKTAYDGSATSRGQFISDITALGGDFCMDTTGAVAQTSTSCTKTVGIDYKVQIATKEYPNPVTNAPEKNMYFITVTWDSAIGDGIGRVELAYGI